MDPQHLTVPASDGHQLALTRWPASGPPVVFLHAGVADRRSWAEVAEALHGDGAELTAHDRRGFGESPAATDPSSFTHVEDLLNLIDGLALDRVLLVGNSMSGALALDMALLHPGRVSGLVLIGAAVSGMTDKDTPFDWEPDESSAPLMARVDDLDATDDERVRALSHLWLDGPKAAEGRVPGDARDHFTTMNQAILKAAPPDSAGSAGIDAWARLDEVRVPVMCTWGEFDLPCDIPFYEETARRLGQGSVRVLPGVAHLPGLEQPALVAEVVRQAAFH